jgi:hypothetical protein
LIKIRTSIKPGNPTLWQDPTVRLSLNYYRSLQKISRKVEKFLLEFLTAQLKSCAVFLCAAFNILPKLRHALQIALCAASVRCT